MKLNKQKWFEKQMHSYEIRYYGYPDYSDNYILIEYYKDGPSRIHRNLPEELSLLTQYLTELKPCARFFEARRIGLKHIRENRKCYVYTCHKTCKTRQNILKKFI